MTHPSNDPVTRRALGFLATVFIIVGFEGLLMPELQMRPVGIVLDSPSAIAEIRAAYGGCFLALAALCVQGVRKPALQDTVLMITTLLLGIFSAARLLSWFVDGAPNSFSYLMHHLEITGFVLSSILWRRAHGHAQRRLAKEQGLGKKSSGS
jgi:hypothetical protein